MYTSQQLRVCIVRACVLFVHGCEWNVTEFQWLETGSATAMNGLVNLIVRCIARIPGTRMMVVVHVTRLHWCRLHWCRLHWWNILRMSLDIIFAPMNVARVHRVAQTAFARSKRNK